MRPTEPVMDWALDELDANNNPIKELPPTEFQQTGTLLDQPWVRIWMNYMFNNILGYIKHLADDPVGTIKLMTIASNWSEQDAADNWGGTWNRSVVATHHAFDKTAL